MRRAAVWKGTITGSWWVDFFVDDVEGDDFPATRIATWAEAMAIAEGWVRHGHVG